MKRYTKLSLRSQLARDTEILSDAMLGICLTDEWVLADLSRAPWPNGSTPTVQKVVQKSRSEKSRAILRATPGADEGGLAEMSSFTTTPLVNLPTSPLVESIRCCTYDHVATST